MASLPEFEKVYQETRGITLVFWMNKKTGKWIAREVNKGERFEAKNSFGLFDKLISHCKKYRIPSKKYEMPK